MVLKMFGIDCFHQMFHPVSQQPTEMQFGMDPTERSFRNLVVSYRSAERQAPNCLQLALRFSRLMEVAEAEGRHSKTWTTEERLRSIISDFHGCQGLANKNHLDEDKTKSILNLISGSCPDSWYHAIMQCFLIQDFEISPNSLITSFNIFQHLSTITPRKLERFFGVI